ncbi:MAG TPA: 16S rRNA (guanine(966)-N(2))-methyltransferase RsmD [Elainellaceae cyanobacterium]
MSLRIYGNRPLKTVPGRDTRPTPARVREALFNIWQGDIAGCRWLDLCAGTGAMSAEALCRGASLVVGIEQSSRACAVIQHNWRQVAMPQQSVHLVRGNILQRLSRLAQQQFDRIYFDPPYASGLYHPTLEAIARHGLLAPNGEIAVEHSPEISLPETLNGSDAEGIGLVQCRQKIYGGTALTFYAFYEI